MDYPDKGIANWEEGRCLFSEHGYSILDIRSKAEIDQIGNFPRELPSDHLGPGRFYEVPLINADYRYNSEAGKKMMTNMEANPDFMSEVPHLPTCRRADHRLLQRRRNRAIRRSGRSTPRGTSTSSASGGYNMEPHRDAKIGAGTFPGVSGGGDSADGCGVRATGASFENQDAFQRRLKGRDRVDRGAPLNTALHNECEEDEKMIPSKVRIVSRSRGRRSNGARRSAREGGCRERDEGC